MWARGRHRRLILACLVAITSTRSVAAPERGTTPAPAPPQFAPGATALSPEARRRLADAAQDSVLAPWQRDFMIGVARAGVAGAAEAGSTEPVRSSMPEDVVPADGRWTVEPPPNPRYHHTAVYDPVRDRMVVFGGYTHDYALSNDVWTLSLAGNPTWTKLAPLGTPPSGRHQHTAIYDPVRDRIVVFGGYERSSVAYLNDVWALTLAGSPRWTQLEPAGTPPITRFAHSAIYDTQQDRMIVFGGYHSDPDGTNAGPLNDVWALSFSDSVAWTEISPTGTPPIARYAHSAIYDPVRRSMIIYAGFAAGLLADDVWELSLSGNPAWTELIPTGTAPVAREYLAAIYDPAGDRMVVFGGYGNGYLGDSWVLSLSGALQWSQLTTAGPQPIGRAGQSGIYDPLRRHMVVFGGTPGGDGLLSDVWALSLDAATTWASLAPNGPSGRYAHSAIYDPARDRMVVFGGTDYGSNFLGDVWTLSLTGNPVWTLLTPAGTPPPPRGNHTAIYDPSRDRMVVFGGQTSLGEVNDVWALSLAGNPTWTQLNPSGTPPEVREGHTAIYDAANDRMVVFGGAGCCAYLNDVWALSLAGDPAWAPLIPPSASPERRGFHSAIYDPLRPRMIVFGGLDGTIGLKFLNDIWELPLLGSQPWSRITPGGQTPRGSEGHSAIYDPVGDRMVVFGGFAYDGLWWSDQAWALSLTTSPTWGLLATAGMPPGGRSFHSAIYDPIGDRMVVFSGDTFRQDVWDLSWGREIPLAVPASPGGAFGPLFACPNPARGDVTISFALPKASATTLRVFDVAGRVVRTLLHETLPAGPYSTHWDRRTVSGAVARPGLYLYELEAGGHRTARRLVLIR